jgi:predicted DNA-binding mobile mystery protein A
MQKTRGWSEFAALNTRQLDARMRANARLREVAAPKDGWIKAIRTALSMTATQLARRMNMKPQSVLDLEKREVAGTITLATLEKAARALECELKIVFVPRTSLDEMLRDQAMMKAVDERNRVAHSMHLEAQDQGVETTLDVEKIADSWLTTRRARLWD